MPKVQHFIFAESNAVSAARILDTKASEGWELKFMVPTGQTTSIGNPYFQYLMTREIEPGYRENGD